MNLIQASTNTLHSSLELYSKTDSRSESVIWKICKIFIGIICLPLGIYWLYCSFSEEKKLPPVTLVPKASLSERMYKTIANHPKVASALAATALTITIGCYALYQNPLPIKPLPPQSFSPLWHVAPFALATVVCCIDALYLSYTGQYTE